MHEFSSQKNANQIQEIEKIPFVVAKKSREAILDEVFKPGDRLTEAELVEKFEVSRSPVREALLSEVFSTPESRPRQREVLIELYRKGKVADAFRTFKKIYLEVVQQLIDHLKSEKI